MMQNAGRWQNFLDYVDIYQKQWADEAHDTDLYRKHRAVEFFNAGLDAPRHAHHHLRLCCVGPETYSIKEARQNI